jgi:hypothetical protein
MKIGSNKKKEKYSILEKKRHRDSIRKCRKRVYCSFFFVETVDIENNLFFFSPFLSVGKKKVPSNAQAKAQQQKEEK